MNTILLTNDDGFDSEGILALRECLSDIARVVVVAPSRERSACGHGLTITEPLRLLRVSDDYYKVDDGSPADCVYLAFSVLFKNVKPDIVLSGINIGSNLGEDVTYSGTVAGAMEGVIKGVPSVAVSQFMKGKRDNTGSFRGKGLDFSLAKSFVRKFVVAVLEHSFWFGERKLVNINIPDGGSSKGVKVTKLGHRLYSNLIQENLNPRGETYYWLGMHPLKWLDRDTRSELCSDFSAVMDGYISVTPITLDMTSYEDVEVIKNFISSAC